MKIKVIKQRIDILTRPIVYFDYERFIEECGRVCYKSEDKITEDSAYNFVKGIIKSGHESVLEHANLTVKFTTDRAMTHSIVRHRHCAFSQESTHFINYRKKDELLVVKQEGIDLNDEVTWELFMQEMANTYEALKHLPHKYTRSIFPTAIKTELVATTNLREWRSILKLRTAPNCHPQMLALMTMLLEWFKENMPIFVEDINV